MFVVFVHSESSAEILVMSSAVTQSAGFGIVSITSDSSHSRLSVSHTRVWRAVRELGSSTPESARSSEALPRKCFGRGSIAFDHAAGSQAEFDRRRCRDMCVLQQVESTLMRRRS